MLLISPQKLFLLPSYLNFCPDTFSHVGKRLDKKVTPKIYDVINWEASNYNMHIALYL